MGQEFYTEKQAIDDKVYPVLDNLGALAEEAKKWYKALGVSDTASFSIATRGVRTISSFINKVVKDVDPGGLAKAMPYYVPVYVTDTASIAYTVRSDQGDAIDDGFSFAVNVGSWLFDREKLDKVVPGAGSMPENERTFLALGMINGAIALDLMTKARMTTKEESKLAVEYRLGELAKFYNNFFVSEPYEEPFGNSGDEIGEIINSLTDLMMVRAVLDKNALSGGWVIFPVLLFRLVANADYCKLVKESVLNGDTFGIEQLEMVVNALKTFSPEGKEILEIDAPEINALSLLLSYSSHDNIGRDQENLAATRNLLSAVVSSYADDLIVLQQEKNDNQSEDGDGEGDGSGNGIGEGEKPPSGVPSPPKPTSAVEKTEGDNLETTSAPYYQQENNEKDSPMERKRKRIEGEPSPDDKNKNSLKNLISDLFKPEDKLDLRNLTTKYYDSMDACLATEQTIKDRRFVSDSEDVYNNINKKSLRNLFMSETMAAVKSEPSKSGVALIQTRIANLYTDGKIFSPLPDEVTEKENEVIILLDASSSMEYDDVELRRKDGTTLSTSRIAGVAGVARALLEGFTSINVRCQAFLFTTPYSDGVPYVTKIADDRSYDKERRFNKMAELYRHFTPEAHALTESARHFTNSGDVGRTLIVLSDGYPECREYSGESGRKLTEEAVKNIREQDIEIYSIALTKGIVEKSKRIYGEEWAIFPADKNGNINLNTLFDEVVKIVSKKATRRADNVYTQG